MRATRAGNRPRGRGVDKSIGLVGFRAGVLACLSALAYDLVQILQVAGVLHFPADEILIYSTSLCIVVPFLLEMLAFHHLTPEGKRFWSHAASAFSLLYAVLVVGN